MLEMKTALLIDGSKNPVALRLKGEDMEKPYLNWGPPGRSVRSFGYHSELTEVKDNQRVSVRLYRLVGLPDETFKASAQAEADKYLFPEKYRKAAEGSDASQTELAEYRRRYGPLKKEA